MRLKHNLLFGLTNDAFGYILTKVDFASFPRYEYVSRTSLGKMTGENLIEKALDLVNRSPAPDHRESLAGRWIPERSPGPRRPARARSRSAAPASGPRQVVPVGAG